METRILHEQLLSETLCMCIYRMTQDVDGSLTIKEVIDSDEGKYQCVAKNYAGTRTSSEVFLLMQGMPFLSMCSKKFTLAFT